MSYELGIIGAGNMAEAIVRGAVAAGVVRADDILAADPSEARRALFAELGATVTERNAHVIAESRRVLIAVKPQVFATMADDLSAARDDQLLVSIMAGVPHVKLAAAAGAGRPIVRVMPNTPLLVGCGMSALSPSATVSDSQLAWAHQLFGAAGEVVTVDESLMDAVTAVSGSGPAYVFYLAEAMTEAAKQLGLADADAAKLTQQTMFGAAKMMVETGVDPAELRRRVTSPGGTTQAAIERLESQGVSQALVAAVRRAAERSAELGRD